MVAATNAISATLTACGVATIDAAIVNCPGLHSTGGATIVDFAANGLDSGYSLCGGGPCPDAASGGIANGANGTTALRGNQMLFPIGRSVFNALQLSLRQAVHNPIKRIRHFNLQVSYQLSRYDSQA